MALGDLTGGRRANREGDRWRTPLGLFDRLNREFGFRLDAACETGNQLAPHGLCRDLGRDGLLEPWTPGPVYCNPPYSHYPIWIERGILASQGGETVVMLIPSDTSTRAWQVVAQHAAEVRFVIGRIKFLRSDGHEHATARKGGGMVCPSAVVVFRPGHQGPPVYSYIDR